MLISQQVKAQYSLKNATLLKKIKYQNATTLKKKRERSLLIKNGIEIFDV